jgi:hypothetical protein
MDANSALLRQFLVFLWNLGILCSKVDRPYWLEPVLVAKVHARKQPLAPCYNRKRRNCYCKSRVAIVSIGWQWQVFAVFARVAIPWGVASLHAFFGNIRAIHVYSKSD